MARCRAWRLHEKNSRQEHDVKRTQQRLNTSGRGSLAQFLDKYLQHLAVKGFSESTLRVRRVHMEMFLKWGRRSRITGPTQITRTPLESYQRYLFQYKKKDGQPLAVASQHSRLAPLKVWFRWLTQRKYIPRDPAAELELPRVGYKLPNVMNKDEAERVLTQPKIEVPLGIRDRTMLEILYSSGLRRMELLHLKLYEKAKARGVSEPTLGRDYGRLSEVAHPTKSAAFNSVTKLSRLGFARSLRVNFSFFNQLLSIQIIVFL